MFLRWSGRGTCAIHFDNTSRAPMAFLFICWFSFPLFLGSQDALKCLRAAWPQVIASALWMRCTCASRRSCLLSECRVKVLLSRPIWVEKRKRSNQIEISNELNINWRWHRARKSCQHRRRLCSRGAIINTAKWNPPRISIRIFQKISISRSHSICCTACRSSGVPSRSFVSAWSMRFSVSLAFAEIRMSAFFFFFLFLLGCTARRRRHTRNVLCKII